MVLLACHGKPQYFISKLLKFPQFPTPPPFHFIFNFLISKMEINDCSPYTWRLKVPPTSSHVTQAALYSLTVSWHHSQLGQRQLLGLRPVPPVLPGLGDGGRVDDSPPLLGQLSPGLGVAVVHLEVGHDDGDGQSHHQDPRHGTHGTHEHAKVSPGHHVTIAHCRHGD